MADLPPFPFFKPVLFTPDPFRNAVRLGLNLWAKSLEERWEFSRKVLDTLSSAFVPEGEKRGGVWEANLELLRIVADGPFALERDFLSLCQSATSATERTQAAHPQSRRSSPDSSAGRQPTGRNNGGGGESAPPPPSAPMAPEAKPLQIQTPIGLNHPVVVPIRLRNHNNRPSHIILSATPFMDDRGWVCSAPAMRFQPAEVQFPGAGSYEASGLIDTRSGFEPNRIYRADILIEGDPTMRIPFYLRTLPPPVRQTPDFTAELLGPPGVSGPEDGG